MRRVHERPRRGMLSPGIIVRAVELDDKLRPKDSWGVRLILEPDSDEGWDPELPDDIANLMMANDPRMRRIKFWPYVRIAPGDLSEAAVINSRRSEPFISEDRGDRGRLIHINGPDAALIFVAPEKGGFIVKIYEPRIHVDAGVPQARFLTGREPVDVQWVSGPEDEMVSELDPVYRETAVLLIERCKKRCDERWGGRDGRRANRRRQPPVYSHKSARLAEPPWPLLPLPPKDSALRVLLGIDDGKGPGIFNWVKRLLRK